MMLLSRVTLAHKKTKLFNLTYMCSEPCKVFAAFLGSKYELKIYSIDLKKPQDKAKKEFPWLVTESDFYYTP